MKCEPVKYNLLQGPVPPGFIYLFEIIQLRTRSLRPLDSVIVSSVTHAIKTKWSKHQMNINIYKGQLRQWSKNPGRQIGIFNCVPKETLVTVKCIDKQWKSWSECTFVLSDLGISCLHNTQSPFFIIWYKCPVSETGHCNSLICQINKISLVWLINWKMIVRQHLCIKDKLMILLIFPKSRLWHIMQIVSNSDSLHDLLN